MKKIIGVFVLFLILSVSFVLAGDTVKIDFTKQNQYLVGLKEGDRAEFYINGERNIIIIDKIKNNSTDITAFIALNTKNYPFYATIGNGRHLKLDVERDNIDDLIVEWVESDLDSGYVYLLLRKPGEIPTGSVVGEVKREKREYDKYIIGMFLVSVFLFVLLIFRRKKMKNNTPKTLYSKDY